MYVSVGYMQVESGKVDLAEDAKGFYNRMMHTLPEFLESADVKSIPQRLQSSMQALEAAKLSKAAEQRHHNLEHAEPPRTTDKQNATANSSSSNAEPSDSFQQISSHKRTPVGGTEMPSSSSSRPTDLECSQDTNFSHKVESREKMGRPDAGDLSGDDGKASKASIQDASGTQEAVPDAVDQDSSHSKHSTGK